MNGKCANKAHQFAPDRAIVRGPTQLNKGLGTKLVCALVELLFLDPAVTKIQTDPAPNNHRAIRCYEKAGLRCERCD